jgi:hypothetical protein
MKETFQVRYFDGSFNICFLKLGFLLVHYVYIFAGVEVQGCEWPLAKAG